MISVRPAPTPAPRRDRPAQAWPAITAMTLSLAAALSGCQDQAAPGFSGYAEADLIYMAPAGAGVLQRLPVARGSHVQPGDKLFEVDASLEGFGRDAAAAQSQRAQAQLQDVSKGRRREEIRTIKAQLSQAKAAARLSAGQLKRQRELVQQGFVSAAQMDELEATQARDQARVKELEAQLALAREAARPDTIAAARADVSAAQAQVSQQTWAAAQKSRQAPVAATVFDVLYQAGEWVPAGQPVVALLPDQGVKVRFFVPQAELSRAKVGGAVQVSCEQCPGGPARIRYVSPQAEFTPPVIYSNESRGKLVYLVEATPEGTLAASLKPGQPLTVRWAP